MKIGTLLRKERKKRGLNLEEMAGGILSASYYAKVEKNQHRISAEDLFTLLEYHHIDPFEFIKLLKTDINSRYNTLHNRIAKCYMEGDRNGIRLFQEEIAQQQSLSGDEQKILLALCEIFYHCIDNHYEQISEEAKNMIKEKIFKLDNWDDFSLSLLANALQIYNLQSINHLVSSILMKNFTDYSQKQQFIILTMLTNLVSYCMLEHEYELAHYYLSIISKTPTSVENFLLKMMANFYRLILDPQPNNEALQAIVQTLHLSGMEDYARRCEEFIAAQKKCIFSSTDD